jgi:mannobiose 2-epimerase
MDKILEKLEYLLRENLLEKFYPLTLDRKHGGFNCNLDENFRLVAPQDKMIVTQARHTWTPAKASAFYPNDSRYKEAMLHGVKNLKETMWDSEFGGFYTMRSPEGGLSDYRGYLDEKRTYGNAFGVYSLAAVYNLTKDKEVLNFAIEAYEWIEKHAYDPRERGYYQFMTRQGKAFGPEEISKTVASDKIESYYKDQNSSIHLLEAYTELYSVYKEEKLRSRLNDLLVLIRDTVIDSRGYMHLFFDHCWNPLSFQDSPKEIREANYGLDHVSFGHDYETAFLMLETSFVLGLKDDTRTLHVAKKLVDHSIENGFDKKLGGFYEAGYYFKGDDKLTIIDFTKNWWAQAEGLNSLLMMSKIFPEEKKYYETFEKLLSYVEKYFIDYERGGWYEGGLDKQPEKKAGPKGHIWKAAYHESRSLMNCIRYLSDKQYHLYNESEAFRKVKDETEEFIAHWQQVKSLL